MGKFRFVILGLAGLVLLVLVRLATLSWGVTRPLNGFLHSIEGRIGCHLSVSQARWIPWRSLELTDLKFQAPQGGRFHVVDLKILPHFGSVIKGYLSTEWKLGEIRIDPGSWRIHHSLMREILSSGPVTTGGFALLQVRPDTLTLQTLRLQGPMVKLDAEGWLTDRRQARLAVNGRVARRFLEEVRLVKADVRPADSWEPFQMRLQGALGRQEFSFASHFFSTSLSFTGDKRS